MANIEIYATPTCGYCHAAKRLLSSKDANYTEYDLFRVPDKRREMMQRARGRRTVPQIFIDGAHIGGCNELYALERAGKLDPLLAG